eukprot:GHRQ01019592.1.p2 GENE.GHRQ01019592.1~~GHRQ01019592.1.p2  ORF type:complete len:109 (-),score=26.62 GHRQ01019592.1:422-748(-)
MYNGTEKNAGSMCSAAATHTLCCAAAASAHLGVALPAGPTQPHCFVLCTVADLSSSSVPVTDCPRWRSCVLLSCCATAQVAEVFTGTPGKYVPLENTIKDFKGVLDGK